MQEKLRHLKDNQIIAMMKRYYEDDEKIADLISEFGLDVHPSGFVGTFPPHVHPELRCPYCKSEHFVSKRLGRDNGPWKIGVPICPVCNHRHAPSCHCKNCVTQKQEEEREIEQVKRDLIVDNFGKSSKDIPLVENLSLESAVYILSLARHSLSEDFFSVRPFAGHTPQFAPTHNYRNEIVKHLYSTGLISISDQSDTSAFDYNEGLTSIPAYYPTSVIWEFLPSVNYPDRPAYINELESLARNGPWPEVWCRDVLKTWRTIAKHECFEHYIHLLEQRGYDLDSFGPKTHTVYDNILERFAVSQAFNLSWQAIRDTTDYLVKEGIPKYHAKNTFIGAIERKADKAFANKWDIGHSRRDLECPQTVVSSTFSDVFLQFGDEAYKMVPFPFLKENY